MNDLIERLEKAAGPSREIDGLIFKLIGDRPGDFWHEFEVGENGDGVWYRQCRDDAVAYECPPTFTDSIDAAMTLVPDQHEGHVDISVPAIGRFNAKLWPLDSTDADDTSEGSGINQAIALCVAALKARNAFADLK